MATGEFNRPTYNPARRRTERISFFRLFLCGVRQYSKKSKSTVDAVDDFQSMVIGAPEDLRRIGEKTPNVRNDIS